MCAVLVVGALLTGACAAPTAQPSAEIAAGTDAFEAAFNAGDTDALAAMYTDDTRLMPPNAPAETGLDAVRAAFGAMIESGLTIELESQSAMAAGDLGYNIGTYTLTAPDGSVVDRGKWIETRRLIDGRWLMSADIWNSDMPASQTGTTTVIGTHEVADFDHWYSAWQGEESRHDLFAANGVPNVRLFQNQENPNLTALIFEATDVEAMQAMLASAEGQAAAAEDGVDMSTLQIFSELE
jgi:ketosteroid isomerase-like protein